MARGSEGVPGETSWYDSVCRPDEAECRDMVVDVVLGNILVSCVRSSASAVRSRWVDDSGVSGVVGLCREPVMSG